MIATPPGTTATLPGTSATADAVRNARAQAKSIGAGSSAVRLASTQDDAKDLRDRAYTYLGARVFAVRAAGRYAFRTEPQVLAKFGSAYQRALDRKRARKKQVPVGDVGDAGATTVDFGGSTVDG
jgi:hypothetical protein